MNDGKRGFFGWEYVAALKEHYPELFDSRTAIAGASTIQIGEPKSKADRELHAGIVDKWVKTSDTGGFNPGRFQHITDRRWNSAMSAQFVSKGGYNLREGGVQCTYKGLLNLKYAIDLVLYSNLMWQLQPRTILEFGSLQGGSALWFSDQLDTLCGHGEVHSFEICYRCISARASHARLHFHEADLRDLRTVDKTLLEALPHPWLVVDDAHENLDNLIPFVAGFMASGDYYVIEDVFLYHPQRLNQAPIGRAAEVIVKLVSICDALGFLVDTKYTDGFGLNVTCAPNGWLVKQ